MEDMRKYYSMTPPGLMCNLSGGCNDNNTNTNDNTDTNFLYNKPIGMAYVPMQQWRNIYEPDKALMRGTIFEELDLPFKGAGHR